MPPGPQSSRFASQKNPVGLFCQSSATVPAPISHTTPDKIFGTMDPGACKPAGPISKPSVSGLDLHWNRNAC